MSYCPQATNSCNIFFEDYCHATNNPKYSEKIFSHNCYAINPASQGTQPVPQAENPPVYLTTIYSRENTGIISRSCGELPTQQCFGINFGSMYNCNLK